MITLKLNLTAFAHALMQSDKEKDEIILCVPVKKNKFFLSEKRNVYLDVVGVESKSDFGNKARSTKPEAHPIAFGVGG